MNLQKFKARSEETGRWGTLQAQVWAQAQLFSCVRAGASCACPQDWRHHRAGRRASSIRACAPTANLHSQRWRLRPLYGCVRAASQPHTPLTPARRLELLVSAGPHRGSPQLPPPRAPSGRSTLDRFPRYECTSTTSTSSACASARSTLRRTACRRALRPCMRATAARCCASASSISCTSIPLAAWRHSLTLPLARRRTAASSLSPPPTLRPYTESIPGSDFACTVRGSPVVCLRFASAALARSPPLACTPLRATAAVCPCCVSPRLSTSFRWPSVFAEACATPTHRSTA
mmetsp:Transcript_3496/g.14149  ORF Transcript_3496/g.14149 Transcript_3496/m.14149 type:complete len:290 (+) Transcript_3496:1215-2084(+)